MSGVTETVLEGGLAATEHVFEQGLEGIAVVNGIEEPVLLAHRTLLRTPKNDSTPSSSISSSQPYCPPLHLPSPGCLPNTAPRCNAYRHSTHHYYPGEVAPSASAQRWSVDQADEWPETTPRTHTIHNHVRRRVSATEQCTR